MPGCTSLAGINFSMFFQCVEPYRPFFVLPASGG
ncbi:Uncharacterised protein [Pseudomonas fluorescens]|nr:Uncharacterised protein [Pseudomonas fluorescens]